MDPEVLRELEENFRRMNEMLARQTELQAGILREMGAQSTATKANTESTKNNTNEQQKQTQAVTGVTKAMEAAAKAEAEYEKAMGNFKASLGSGVNALSSFTEALLNGKEGFAKYGSALGSAGDAALSLGKNFGILGTVLGGAVKGVTMLGEAALAQADNTLKATDQMAKFGTAGAMTTKEFLSMAHAAGVTSKNLDLLVKPLTSMGPGLAALGATAGAGAKAFGEMTAISAEQRMAYRRLGVSQEELIQNQADYVALQRASGFQITEQMKRDGSLKKASLEYTNNLLELSALTGKNVDQIKKEQQAALMREETMIQTNMMERRIQKLRDQGETAQADKLQAELNARNKLLQNIESQVGDQKLSDAMSKFLATGAITEETAFLKRLGVPLEEFGARIKAGEDVTGDFLNTLKKNGDAMLDNVGTAAMLDKGAREAFGYSKEFLQYLSQRRGVDETEARTKVEKEQNIASKSGFDAAQDARAKLTEVEIAAKVELDKLLLSVNPLINGFDGTKAAALAAAAAVTALAVASGIAAKRMLSGGRPGAPGAPAKTPTARPRDARGRFTKAPPPSMWSRATGFLGRAAGTVGRIAGKAFLPVAAGMAAYDAYKAGSDAEGTLGITGRKATFGEKLAAGAGGALSGLTFGLVGADTIGKGLMQIGKVFGAGDNSVAEKEIQATKEVTEATESSAKQLENLEEMRKNMSLTEKVALDTFTNRLDLATRSLDSFRTAIDTIAQLTSSIGTGGFGGGGAPSFGGGGGGGAPQVPAQLGSYMAATAMIESGGRADARAKTSSAGGMFQFLDSTWRQLTREMGKDYSLQDKFDPRKAAEVMAYFTEKQRKQLERGTGKRASNTDLYMAHFLGSGGAVKFLNAMNRNPNAIAADLDPRAARANRSIYYDGNRARTLAEVYELMNKKMSGAMAKVQQGGVPDFVAQLARGGGPASGVPDMAGSMARLPKNIDDILEFSSPSGTKQNFAMLDGAMQSAVANAALEYYNQTGKKIQVNSARRSRQDQERLYNAWLARGKTGMPAAPPGSSLHERGDAIDIQNYRDSKAVSAMNKQGLFQTVRGDPVHFQLRAANGGLFDGPATGYPVELHGSELVAPLDPNSVLMELAKTPATGDDAKSTMASAATEKAMSMNAELMQLISSKLDTMIEALETGNDTSDKLLKYSRT